MLKKIMFIMMTVLFTASTTAAFGMNGSASTTNNAVTADVSVELMGEFDNLVKEVKKVKTQIKEKSCPLNFPNPIALCGKGVKVIVTDKDENGCAVEYGCDIKASTVSKEALSAVIKDEKKLMKEVQLRGNIKITGEPVPGAEILIEQEVGDNLMNGELNVEDDIEKLKLPKLFKGNMVFKMKDGKYELNGKGILNNGKTTAVSLKAGSQLEIEASVEGEQKINFVSEGKNIKINFNDKEQDVAVEEGELKIGEKTVKIKFGVAETKAKNASTADVVLSTEIKTEENGNVNFVMKTQKKGKFFGFFETDLESEVKIDVETGVVVEVNTPWYSFLVF